MMQKAIQDFPKQFLFAPVIERAEKLEQRPASIVSGMGGSHLAADLLKTLYPEKRIIVHSDYGLPSMLYEDLQKCLFIASSYSGNTEEVLDGLEQARVKEMACAAVSVGGKLQKIAEQFSIPYIQLPDTGIQPRMALGFGTLGIMKILAMDEEIRSLRSLADILKPNVLEQEGKRLSELCKDKIPVVYSSARNRHVAANWKIKCNETGKIPAFYNVFPELNHNEMTGFDIVEARKQLSAQFHIIVLADSDDDPRIQKRMEICKRLFEDRNLPVTVLEMNGSTRAERVFNSLLTADWFAYYSGSIYGAETEQVPMVGEFKKLVSSG